jgi:heat-inducible transcriptional repressor
MTTDAQYLPDLTRRQEEILSLIVRIYTQTQDPVSSKKVAEDLNISSATVRNEMAVLEQFGYVAAPHTSAGRVPTQSGYRYFVRRLLTADDLPSAEQRYITERFQNVPTVTEQWMRAAATILARMANGAALVTAPIAETNRFKHLELIAIQGRLVLMVLVVYGGTVHQRMLNLAEPVPQAMLSEVANRLNRVCVNLTTKEMRMRAVTMQALEREVMELAAELLDGSDQISGQPIYREGLTEIMRGFPDASGAEQVLRVFEERAFLETILSEMLPQALGNVQVFVAGEGREELSQLSFVLSRYGAPGQVSGAVGVLGPTHINYGRAISTVRYVSTLMTSMVSRLYADDTPSATQNTSLPSSNDQEND